MAANPCSDEVIELADPLREYFGNNANCFKELAIMRQWWGDKNTTVEQWEVMRRTLGLMLCNCDDEISYIVRAAAFELEWRCTMAGILFMPEAG